MCVDKQGHEFNIREPTAAPFNDKFDKEVDGATKLCTEHELRSCNESNAMATDASRHGVGEKGVMVKEMMYLPLSVLLIEIAAIKEDYGLWAPHV